MSLQVLKLLKPVLEFQLGHMQVYVMICHCLSSAHAAYLGGSNLTDAHTTISVLVQALEPSTFGMSMLPQIAPPLGR